VIEWASVLQRTWRQHAGDKLRRYCWFRNSWSSCIVVEYLCWSDHEIEAMIDKQKCSPPNKRRTRSNFAKHYSRL